MDDANDASDSPKLTAARADPGAHQLIVAGLLVAKSVKGLALGNAPNFSSELTVQASTLGDEVQGPFGPPVLQLPSDAVPLLIQAVESSATATGVCAATRTPGATACNVEATFIGTDPSLAPIVVMTPRSGWWACASERGPGLSTFIELARTCASEPLLRTVIFTANSGHECGHLGMHAFSCGPTAITGPEAHCWLHLGANFGSTNEGTDPALPQDKPTPFIYQTTDTVMEAQLLRHLEGVKQAADPVAASRMMWEAGWVGGRPARRPLGGEAVNVHAEGGRFVSLVGVNQMFHHPADLFGHGHELLQCVRQFSAHALSTDTRHTIRRLMDNGQCANMTAPCSDACDVPKLALIVEAMVSLTKELASETVDGRVPALANHYALPLSMCVSLSALHTIVLCGAGSYQCPEALAPHFILVHA